MCRHNYAPNRAIRLRVECGGRRFRIAQVPGVHCQAAQFAQERARTHVWPGRPMLPPRQEFLGRAGCQNADVSRLAGGNCTRARRHRFPEGKGAAHDPTPRSWQEYNTLENPRASTCLAQAAQAGQTLPRALTAQTTAVRWLKTEAETACYPGLGAGSGVDCPSKYLPPRPKGEPCTATVLMSAMPGPDTKWPGPLACQNERKTLSEISPRPSTQCTEHFNSHDMPNRGWPAAHHPPRPVLSQLLSAPYSPPRRAPLPAPQGHARRTITPMRAPAL